MGGYEPVKAHGWRCKSGGPGNRSYCTRKGKRFKFKWSIAVERVASRSARPSEP